MTSSPRIGIYPGTFDPITSGHNDIIERASRLVDVLIVAIAANAGKGPLLDLAERTALVEGEVAEIAARSKRAIIKVESFSELLVHFAAARSASVIIRGLRAVSDFEFEFQMAGMNSKLNPEIETAFLMAGDGQHFVSSRFVKEIGSLGGDISRFVSPPVGAALKTAFARTGQ
ncbi:MAG: pantetheine-phosphate adenylyltransferase [Candidatus Pacebacteria bacterium]|nr:pantetheine-phosphate adenylyltransferase [Candidatus Paceibacterota bacterium]